MMGVQRYPEVRPAPNSGILEPYDVAAWSLPLMMGVKAERASIRPDVLNSSRVLKAPEWPNGGLSNASGKYFSIAAHENNIYALANAMQTAGGQVFLSEKPNETPEFIFPAHAQLAANAEKLHLQLVPRPDLPQGATQLKPVRLGIYKSYIAEMDEGWTRFLLDQYGFKYKSLENKEVRAGNLNNSFDVIILPDSSREVIVDGKESRFGFSEEFPPEYVGGIGKEGVKALRDFVDKGGTLITFANASDVLLGEDFGLPIRNALASPSAAQGRAAVTRSFRLQHPRLTLARLSRHQSSRRRRHASRNQRLRRFADRFSNFAPASRHPAQRYRLVSRRRQETSSSPATPTAPNASNVKPPPSPSCAAKAKSSCSASAFNTARKPKAPSNSSLTPSIGEECSSRSAGLQPGIFLRFPRRLRDRVIPSAARDLLFLSFPASYVL